MNRKYLKTLTSLLIIGAIPTAISITTSCSTANEKPKQDAEKIKNYIETNRVNIQLNKETIKLTDFDQKDLIQISLIITDNTLTEEEKEIIKNTKITFSSYLIPHLNEDEKSTITFKLNDVVNINITDLKKLKSPTNKEVTITKLSAEEIKQVIKEKLNENLNFTTATKTFLINAIEDAYKDALTKPSIPSDPNDPNSPQKPNPDLNFARWWESNGVFFVKNSYEAYLYKTYPNLFLESLKNLNVNVYKAKTATSNDFGIEEDNTDPKNKKWHVNIKIYICSYPLIGNPITEEQVKQASYLLEQKLTITKPKI